MGASLESSMFAVLPISAYFAATVCPSPSAQYFWALFVCHVSCYREQLPFIEKESIFTLVGLLDFPRVPCKNVH